MNEGLFLLSFRFIQSSSEKRQNRTDYKLNFYIKLHIYASGWQEKYLLFLVAGVKGKVEVKKKDKERSKRGKLGV